MSTQTDGPESYPEPDRQPDFPGSERRILGEWQASKAFERSVEGLPRSSEGGHEFVFYDGPPFANGLPHFGHLLTGYAKDVIPRFQTMRGRRTERRFGWDCHGLPAEMEAEKQLGISGRQKIVEYGMDRFNAHCRESVLKYTAEWESQVTRQGRWVDFENDYKTMDLSYMESVLWAFKQLHEKGLIYEGYRVLPYSWAAETPVSNFETRIDNSYRERDDPAVTVRFELVPQDGDPGPLDLVIWTTTPWTLPSNLAVAVGPDIQYSLLKLEDRVLVMGTAAKAKYARELEAAEEVGTIMGSELVGRAYQPPFDYFVGHPGAHVVLSADFVNTEDGTGIVHMAPGFGEDDQRVCEEHGITMVVPVDEKGRFTSEVADFAGVNVFEANKPIIKALKERGRVLRHEQYRHNYPHCWRTDEPLIYRAMPSWYVEVTKVRDRMVELNQEIRWVPEHIRDGQFGLWLANARDWSISRNRFWGTPIPVWKSDDPTYPRIDVYGSLDELERDFGVRPTDLHRPAIDELVRPNPDDPTGKSMMRRVEDVLDCWFESGSMPFASVHYPFEQKEWFEAHFPADFIVEYVAQTRGWFYTLMVLGTALFDRPPFKNVICHGVVVASDGQKLSKRLKNYPPPKEMFDKFGSDAVRWHLMSSPVMRGGDLAVSLNGEEFGEVVRLVLNPIRNAYSFFSMYANADGVRAAWRTDSSSTLDRYALAKTRALVERTTEALENYDMYGACAEVRLYLDALNNWYIRRARPRFWSKWSGEAEADQSKRDAYDTLYTCLHTLVRVVAPLLPFLAEEIYQGLTGEESVHLTAWPTADDLPGAENLVSGMDRVRDVCSTALGLREAQRLRVRQPLAELVVAGTESAELKPLLGLIADEVNVKSVRTSADLANFGSFRLALNSRAIGPRVGKRMKELLAASKAGEWKDLGDGRVEVCGVELSAPGDYTLQLDPVPAEGWAMGGLPSNDGVVALDARLTPELEREGLARDAVRLIQEERKRAGLHISDRVVVRLDGPAAVRAAVEEHADYVSAQVLGDALEFGEIEGEASQAKVGGEPLRALVRLSDS